MSSQVRNEQIQMLSKTILMNETNSKTTKLGHVVEIGVCENVMLNRGLISQTEPTLICDYTK